MKRFLFVGMLFLMLMGFADLQANAAEYSPLQQQFFDECSGKYQTNWFYDCVCATEEARELILADQTKRLEDYIKHVEGYCEGNGHPRGKPTKNSLDIKDTKKYDNSCELLEVIKGYQPTDVTPMRTDSIWLAFTSLNQCKNEQGIYNNTLENCTFSTEEECACYAEKVTQSWLNHPGGMDSNTTVDIMTKAGVECRK